MERMNKRNYSEILRDEMYMRDRITAVLRQSPKTIPEIAGELGHPSDEVMIWLMGMRRSGLIAEMPKGKVDDYYKYKLRDQNESC
jgi:hypothetical protein